MRWLVTDEGDMGESVVELRDRRMARGDGMPCNDTGSVLMAALQIRRIVKRGEESLITNPPFCQIRTE